MTTSGSHRRRRRPAPRRGRRRRARPARRRRPPAPAAATHGCPAVQLGDDLRPDLAGHAGDEDSQASASGPPGGPWRARPGRLDDRRAPDERLPPRAVVAVPLDGRLQAGGETHRRAPSRAPCGSSTSRAGSGGRGRGGPGRSSSAIGRPAASRTPSAISSMLASSAGADVVGLADHPASRTSSMARQWSSTCSHSRRFFVEA